MQCQNARVSVPISPTFFMWHSGILHISLCVSSCFGGSGKPGAASDLQSPWSMRLVIEAPGQIVYTQPHVLLDRCRVYLK